MNKRKIVIGNGILEVLNNSCIVTVSWMDWERNLSLNIFFSIKKKQYYRNDMNQLTLDFTSDRICNKSK